MTTALTCSTDERLIVALDNPDILASLKLVETLQDRVGFYKVGLGMLTKGGLALANELKRDHGKRIFLDLKLFDIGATVEAAVAGLVDFELDFLTVHGDPYVVEAAARAAKGSNTKILAVTILTSLDRDDLDGALIKDNSITDLVSERAERAFAAGADGVIASSHEASAIRSIPGSRDKFVVTPGIRLNQSDNNDQKRVATPDVALKNGASHLVIGRPIWASNDPIAVVDGILSDMANCTSSRT